MKIALDKRKYKMRMRIVWLLSIFFTSTLLVFMVININNNTWLNTDRIIMIFFLVILLSIIYYLLFFNIRLKKKHKYVMILENGVFNDYSKPFNRALDLKVADIKNIVLWQQTNQLTQYKITTIKEDETKSELSNQIKGKHFYITDYVVDENELALLINNLKEQL